MFNLPSIDINEFFNWLSQIEWTPLGISLSVLSFVISVTLIKIFWTKIKLKLLKLFLEILLFLVIFLTLFEVTPR